jgi:hypothetical protein
LQRLKADHPDWTLEMILADIEPAA